jgi:hypothetical protein
MEFTRDRILENRLGASVATFAIAGIIVFASFSTTSKPARAVGSDRDVVATEFERRVIPMVAAWEKRSRTIADPRLPREITGEVVHFREIFAFEYSSGSRQEKRAVMRNLANDDWLESPVQAFLDGLSRSRGQVESLFSRLAKRSGSSAEAAGWPSMVPSSYVLHDLAGQLSGEVLLIADGLAKRKYLPYHKFLVGPGTHELKTRSGERFAFDVDELRGTSTKGRSRPAPGRPSVRGGR